MENFEFFSPTKFVFGKGAEMRLGSILQEKGAQKVLVHYGRNSAKQSGLLQRLLRLLDEAGISYLELGGVEPNPRAGLVYQGIELCKNENVDFTLPMISDVKVTDGGAISTIKIGGVEFKGTKIRELFDLRSANFTIDVIDNDVIFDVRGYGHGVGMSQYGANFMAKNGSSYIQILKKYYQGVKITDSYNYDN
jgi:SpoIID/LytB domain protein